MVLKAELPEGQHQLEEGEYYTAWVGLKRVHDSAPPWKCDWMVCVQLFPDSPGVMVTMELVLGTLTIWVRTRFLDEESGSSGDRALGWTRRHNGYRTMWTCVPSVLTQWAVRAGHVGTTISIVDGDE